MARELGMGVTPWSPLGGGALTNKFKRAQHGQHKPNRGDRVNARLTEKAYDLLEEILEDNLAATSVALTSEQIAKLDALSKPTFPFPLTMMSMAPMIINGGTTVNGRSAPAWPATPANDKERW